MRGFVIAASAATYIAAFVPSVPRAFLSNALGALPAHLLGVFVKVLPALLLSAFPARARLGPRFSSYGALVSRALLLSALGDLLLDFCDRAELGGEAAFLCGLGAFLLAHALYCAGFLATVRQHAPSVALVLCAPSAIVLRFLAPHILAGKDAPLLPAVLVYVAVITCMLYLAAVREAHCARGYWLTVGGAALFLLSDAVLAWDKFAPPPLGANGRVRWWFRAPKVVVMCTYYAAQMMIAAGAAVEAPASEKKGE